MRFFRTSLREKTMKSADNKSVTIAGLSLIAAFALWTVAVGFIDVKPVGPNGSAVGFSTLNMLVKRVIGVHMALYVITDWLGIIPVAVAFGFAVSGFVQLVARRSLLKVDHSILALGAFYIIVIAVYLLFEKVVVNYRPVLIDGYLEASYPSSTTLLALCVMPTAAMQLGARVRNKILRNVIVIGIAVFTAFMVIGRLISGVHWLSDIIGGALFSAGLDLLYFAVFRIIAGRSQNLLN